MQHSGFWQPQIFREARGRHQSRPMLITSDQHLRDVEAWSAVLVLSVRMTRWGTRSNGTERQCHVPEAAARMDFAGGQGIFRAMIWTGQSEVLGLWVVVESWPFSEWLICFSLCAWGRSRLRQTQ